MFGRIWRRLSSTTESRHLRKVVARPRQCGLAVALALLCGLVTDGALASASAMASVPSGRWQEIGTSVDGSPVGDQSGLAGRVSAVAVIPGKRPTEVVGTLGGIWEQQSGGRWVDVTSPRWPSTAINSLAVDPRDHKIVYAGTGYDVIDDADGQPGAGVLKSVDGGRSWTPLAATESPLRGYAVEGLAVEPRDDRVVIAAANNGVFRSGDSGRTWTEVLPIKPGPFSAAEVRLAIDPVTGDLLVGVAQSAGSALTPRGHAIYESTDGGLRWRAFELDSADGGAGLVLAPGLATAHHHTYAYAVYMTDGRGSGIYTSANGGRSWRFRTSRRTRPKGSIAQLVVDPGNPKQAYFAQEDGPFEYTWGRSTVGLIGRRHTAPKFGDWRALALGGAAKGAQALYGGNDGGTAFYNFKTRTFDNNNAGLVSGIDYFAAAQSADQELTGAQDLGVDAYGGQSAVRELYHADGYGVLIDRNHPTTYYAGVNAEGGSLGFAVSHDSGRNWSSVTLPQRGNEPYYMRLVQASNDPSVLLLPENGTTLFVSTDDGAHWAARSVPLAPSDYLTVVNAALIPGTSTPVIYAGSGFGSVMRSSDLGLTWTNLNAPTNGLSVGDIAIDGAASTGAAAEHVFVSLRVYAPAGYAGTTNVGGVLATQTSGQSWTDISGHLSATSVNALLVDGSTLLAGTESGVEQYDNGTWIPLGSDFPDVRVNDLVLSADGRAIFATTYGRGTLRLLTN